jgi:hypothetical protein
VSELITSMNLDEVVQKNKSIESIIRNLINDFTVRYNQSGVSGREKLAFKILKEHHLLQIPIDDEFWGGAIVVMGSLKIPIINTAQPRVYQYFVAWHEVYHLLYDANLANETHDISVDFNINERIADYFAAQMMVGNVYDYYHSLDDTNFIDRVIKCMDVYEAPYKAVLIQLYEEAVTKYNNVSLKNEILNNFDFKPANLVRKFEELELDSELVKPSNIVSMGGLEKEVQRAMMENPSASYHEDNYKFLNELKAQIKGLKVFISEVDM